MGLYRKKPVEIEAFQWLADLEPTEQLGWLMDALQAGTVRIVGSGEAMSLLIETLEGAMTARPGDWVIKGVKGEIYPCKPDIFAQTYDAVGAPAPKRDWLDGDARRNGRKS
jgi:hypothetical protein